ncbi:MAG: indolepyruvate ferredoxin oxidoreductase subunit alpha [Synergistaceae bacterium]|jgi:indolepyruvate ferredoxin oxidoreductase alpha subunit|nr:indolepyruvate ferredoxin oxidoreductase subunit alpha [Synergistaceae bacterium]
MRKLMTGNEAIAQGAWEAGCHVATAYPGTPSSEILENISRHREIDSEWSTNEKVALEAASGASLAGARAIAAMKHVGLNVAADPFFTMSYIGTRGGLVVVTADDPGQFSSQNEQDNRWYALHAKTPMFEPSDSQECKDFVIEAFDLSERRDAPVLLRVTTRICHSKSIVNLGDRREVPVKPYERDRRKCVMMPAMSMARRRLIEDREASLRDFSNNCPYNRIEMGTGRGIGVISSGISYQHARDALSDLGESVSWLKLGFTYPLPDKLIERFASGVETVYVIEENEPYIENFVKQLGIECIGRSVLPSMGELNSGIIRSAVSGARKARPHSVEAVPPPRPPVLCPGCSHRGIFFAMSKYKDIAVSSDIGCYTLGVLPPLEVGDASICMGSGISTGIGFEKAIRAYRGAEHGADVKGVKKVFGVIGDSTFFHSGITGLIDAVVNGSGMALCILDNRITAMTGHQENPGTGLTAKGDPTVKIDLRSICVACGVRPENVRTVDPYDLAETERAVREAYDAEDIFVIITTRPCALIKDVAQKRSGVFCAVEADLCVMCGMCMRIGCPAISKQDTAVEIERAMCNGCSMCAQVCPKRAISRVGEIDD